MKVWEDTFYRTGFSNMKVSQRQRIDVAENEKITRLVKTKDSQIIESMIGEEKILLHLQELYEQNHMVSIDQITDLSVICVFRFERRYLNDIKVDTLLINPPTIVANESKLKMFKRYEEECFEKEFKKLIPESTFTILNEKRCRLKFKWKRLHYVLDGYSVDSTASELDDLLHCFCPAEGKSRFDPFP
jgi:hypothetical protein